MKITGKTCLLMVSVLLAGTGCFPFAGRGKNPPMYVDQNLNDLACARAYQAYLQVDFSEDDPGLIAEGLYDCYANADRTARQVLAPVLVAPAISLGHPTMLYEVCSDLVNLKPVYPSALQVRQVCERILEIAGDSAKKGK